MKKILLVLGFIACISIIYAQNIKDYPRFQSSQQMLELAGPNRLSHRIFYEPSTGKDAKWFDVVKKGDLALIKSMLLAGQDIEAKDEGSLGQTALGWVCFLGYFDIVEYLVAQKANLYATDRADVTSVFKSAVLGGQIKVVNYLYPLMKTKLDLNHQDAKDGESMLMVAVDNNRVEVVKFLIAKGADVNLVSKQLNRNAYSYAQKRNNQIMLDILTKAGAKPL